MIKVIIAGGRDFANYGLLKNRCNYYLKSFNSNDIEIVSGKARGADSLGERYALEKGIKIIEFPADWNMYGKRAGFYRNEQMAKYATHLIAFWDGESKGTKHMLDLAKSHNLEIKVVQY